MFTYRVYDYTKCLQQIYKVKKQILITKKQGLSDETMQDLESKAKLLTAEAEDLHRNIYSPNNRLDFVFVTFQRESDKEIFLAKYETGILRRLWFKLCCCCSPTSINGQHINIFPAPDPEDIDWLSLEANYWTKKAHRMACYYMCSAILVFGVMFQY